MTDKARREGIRLARMIMWWSRQEGMRFEFLAEKIVPLAEKVLKNAGAPWPDEKGE